MATDFPAEPRAHGDKLHSTPVDRGITADVAESLGVSDSHSRELGGVLPALLVTTTAAGEIEDISASYREYTGLTLTEAKNWQEHQVIHPDDLEQSMQVWTTALQSGEPMQNEMRLRRHDGRYRWYLVQAMPVRADDGSITRWVTVNIDIDDRKQAEIHERYLAEATAKLVSPLDSTGMLVEIARLATPMLADVCAIGLFDEHNQTIRLETSGAYEEERPHIETIHLRRWRASPNDKTTVGELVSRGRPAFIPDFSRDFIEACAPDEQQRSAALAMRPQSIICLPLFARGETNGIVTFAMTRSGRRYNERDLSLLTEVAARLSIALENERLFRELKATADDLRQANAAKDEFLSLVSHELRTPITVIMGNAHVLANRDGRISDAQRQEALTDIHAESDRLNRIIENLLILARIERGQVDIEPLAIDAIIRDQVDSHLRQYPGRTVNVCVEKDGPPALANELSVEQVVRNVLSNAEKYSPQSEPIDISVARNGDAVVVAISDGGMGIAPEEAAAVFDPYYRSSKTTNVSGVGIGLTVCKRLVESMSGKIWAAPRAGGGTTITFTLPSAEANSAPAQLPSK